MVWSRVLTRTETPESLAFFSGLVTSGMGFGWMAVSRVAGPQLTGVVWAGLVAMGVFCALGALCFYVAVKHTSAANVSQYHYTQLITGTLLTYAVWGTRPGVWVLVGGGLIVGRGVYVAVGAGRQLSASSF
jgi:drug/metabolite transporter (DMT)-like permease